MLWQIKKSLQLLRLKSLSIGEKRNTTTHQRNSLLKPICPILAFTERFSLDNFPNCFKEYADLLDWHEYWHTTLDTSDAPCWKWFVGGKINASYNCVDRHLAKNKNKTAIHFVPEPESEKYEHITYQELWVRVNEFAALVAGFCRVLKPAIESLCICRCWQNCRSPCWPAPGWV